MERHSIDTEKERVAERQLLRLMEAADPVNRKAVDTALAAAGLSRGPVVRGEGRVTLACYHQVVSRVCVDIPEAVVRMMGRLQLADLGLYGYAIATSRTLGDALKLSVSFLPLTEERFWQRLESEGERARMRMLLSPSHLHQEVEAAEEFTVGQWRQLHILLPEEMEWNRVEVRFAYAAPVHAAAYREVFECPIIYSSEHTEVLFPVAWLEIPVATADREVTKLCAEKCHEILADLGGSGDLAQQTQRLIVESRFKLRFLGQVADTLHMSPRTLREHLYHSGTNFREILLTARMQLAQRFLESTATPIDEISHLLGYADSSVFFRAFKRHSGCAPGQYRRSRQKR